MIQIKKRCMACGGTGFDNANQNGIIDFCKIDFCKICGGTGFL